MKTSLTVFLTLMLSGLCAAQTTSARATQTRPQFDPQAAKLLKESLETYRGCASYDETSRLTVTLREGEQVSNQSFDSKVALVRPNKLVFEWPSVSLVCDGKQCQTIYPQLKQYVIKPAPEKLTKEYLLNFLMDRQFTVILEGLLGDKPFEAMVDEMKALELMKNNSGKGATVSFIEGTDRVVMTIDLKTKLIRNILRKPANPNNTKWEMNLSFSEATVNQPIKDSVFKISEPKDIRKVDRISFTRQYDYPKLGEIIPDGTLEILGKKTPISIKGHLGKKMTFLTFWATWCPPCRAEIPVLQDVYRKYKNKGVQVLAVNVDSKDDRDGVKEFSDDLKLEFPIPLDPESAFSSYFGFESIPFMLVLDGKGTILEAHSGKGPNTEKELDAIAEKYTAEKN